MKIYIVLILFVVVLIFGVFMVSRNHSSLFPLPLSTPSVSQPSAIRQFIPSPPDVSTLRVGGSSYSDSAGVYTFLYPSDYSFDTQNDGKYIRLVKRGETQKGQTELYDGVLIVFEVIDLHNQTLEQWVDSSLSNMQTSGTSEIAKPKEAVLLRTYPGFTYETKGFGSAATLIIQRTAQSPVAVQIVYSVNDPQNKNYIQEVDSILSTLELHK
jgi:hypothetical protein